jgi:hypothetical protein
MSDVIERATTWKRVSASIFDFFTVFIGVVYSIALATEDTTSGGFNLQGAPAFALFALILQYSDIAPRHRRARERLHNRAHAQKKRQTDPHR